MIWQTPWTPVRVSMALDCAVGAAPAASIATGTCCALCDRCRFNPSRLAPLLQDPADPADRVGPAAPQGTLGPGLPAIGLQLAQDFAQWVRAGDMAALGSLAPQELLGWLQKLCHDLMCLAQGAAPRYFLPAHLPPAPRLAVLLRWSQALNQEMRVAEHPFQPALTVQALVVQARSVLHSKN